MATRKKKTEYLAAKKYILVNSQGCARCMDGKTLRGVDEGFEKFWTREVNLKVELPYVARRFVFKYTDPRESDVPVAKLPRQQSSSLDSIDEALSRCVILCRTCADPRRKSRRKDDDRCQTQPTSETSPSDS